MGFSNYRNKRLCDVVFPGAHDAGIYGNGISGTARTQNLNIAQQAAAGVRYFDLRIATVKTTRGLERRAYHAPALVRKTTAQGAYQVPSLVKAIGLPMLTGVGADRLSVMLDQARAFVMKNPGEFLILRFSKSGDMEDVANQCLLKLGDERFSRDVNINEAPIGTLQGKVVTLFSEQDYERFSPPLKQTPGILPVRASFPSGKEATAPYDPRRIGLQYFGKYSNTGSADKNARKQSRILHQAPAHHPELMGMLYWTLTTRLGECPLNILECIEKRDRQLWSATAQQTLARLWTSDMREHLRARAGHLVPQSLAACGAIGKAIRAFMPNIIMMDFADYSRCATVWNLNSIPENMLDTLGRDLALRAA